jgi:hypothetical protein
VADAAAVIVERGEFANRVSDPAILAGWAANSPLR